MSGTDWTYEAYSAAILRHEDARKQIADAKHLLELAELELEAAEIDLSGQEAYPGISARAHADLYETTMAGQTCGLLPRCRVHGTWNR